MSVNGKKEHVNMFVTKFRTEKLMISYASDKSKIRTKAKHDNSFHSAKVIAIYDHYLFHYHIRINQLITDLK